ncbi:unnamed protein product, partial [marine sediment metagenome]
IGNHALVFSGFSFKSKDFSRSGIPVVKIKNVKNREVDLTDTEFFPDSKVSVKHSKFFIQDRDVLIAMTGQGSVGRVGRIRITGGKKVLLNQRVGKFVTDPIRLNLAFLFHVISTPRYEQILFDAGSGSGQPNLSPSIIGSVKIPMPPLEKQEAIANILDALDDKIELNRRINATLEAMAQAIFKSWFVDFDPVRAKMEGKQPYGMDTDTTALFPDSLEDSELGLIPKGWEVSQLGSLSHILNGFAFKSKDYCGTEGVRVLRTKNFSDSGHAAKKADDVFLPNSFLESHAEYTCRAFDFHLVMVGASVGKTSILLPNMLPALRNQNMWCFRPKEQMESRIYLNYSVRRKAENVLSWADGSARSFFRKSDFKRHKILLPAEALLRDFERISHSYFAMVACNTSENEKLTALRDTLLPKLMSGELRVKEAEKILEEK